MSWKKEKFLVSRDGKKYLFKENDLHTDKGLIKKGDVASAEAGGVVKSNTGAELGVINPQFPDMYERIRRRPQIIPLKDVAMILAEAGIGKESVIFEAGSGSGAFTCFAANIAKKVFSFENREDHMKVVEENLRRLGMDNVILTLGDVCDPAVVKPSHSGAADLFLLDLPAPWEAIQSVSLALKPGGFVINYSPTITQIMRFSEELLGDGKYIDIKVVETFYREWEVCEKRVRPRTFPIAHSGFIFVGRKILS